MAESVVSFLLGKIGLFLDEKNKLQGGIRDEVMYVKDQLEHMRAFLRAAEAMEEQDPQVSVWVKQVRDIAFDIEDAIAEFNLRLARDQKDGLCRFISIIAQKIKNLKYRHQIASAVQGIKPRIQNASEAYKTFKLNVTEQSSSSRSVAGNDVWYERRGDALLLEEAEVVGIDKQRRQLIEWLKEDDPALMVISVVGMGGLGKTTLVKKVYDNPEVKKHFNSHAWITVSTSFKIEELLKDIICKLFDENKQPIPQRMEAMDATQLKVIIRNFLQESRYLLVLDDVWSSEAWDAINTALPQNVCGSRVMLTTRIVEVARASSVQSEGKVYDLKPLSFEDSWKLFCKKTFQGEVCPSHLKDISKKILEKCQGLPLAIVAVGGLLAIKDRSRIDEWEMVKLNLGSELKSVERILLLSYSDLPFYLKACLLYIAVFPEDYEINCMRLIRLWIAEGFVEEKEGKTPEEVAEIYLTELANRNLIHVAQTHTDGRIRFCRIHDILREVITSKSKDQGLVVISNVHNIRWHEKTRRLSVQSSLDNVPQRKHFKKLRSLLVFDVKDFSLASFVHHLRLLQALDLRGTNLEIFPENVVKLYHLKYLSLRDTKVSVVPASIEKLQNLETLDLKGTYVSDLPHTIINLKQLCHLLVYHQVDSNDSVSKTMFGFKAISGVGGLQSLQQLYLITEYERTNVLEELGMLNQLRRLEICIMRREDWMPFCRTIERLSNLRSLIAATNEEFIELEQLSTPPKFLRRLELYGVLEKVPHWIHSLRNLCKLILCRSQLKTEVLEQIQTLPNLVHLHLDQAFDGETLCFKAEMFRKLKQLYIYNLHRLRCMEMENSAMPDLEILDITRCGLLKKVPSGIEYLANLKSLCLDDLSEELINSVDQDKGGEEYWKLEHITVVNLGFFKDGKWIRRKL